MTVCDPERLPFAVPPFEHGLGRFGAAIVTRPARWDDGRSPEMRSQGSRVAMKIMDDYTGMPGRARYAQRSQVRQFTIWSKKDDREAMLYIYVPNAQIFHDPSLKLVCESATDVDSGFMVRAPRWESMVTPEGFLIPSEL
jgi:hypothetical protein